MQCVWSKSIDESEVSIGVEGCVYMPNLGGFQYVVNQTFIIIGWLWLM